MGVEGTIFRKESRIEEVPYAPKEDVVGVGIGLSSGPDGTYDAGVLPVAGHAREGFNETSRRVVVHACPAID